MTIKVAVVGTGYCGFSLGSTMRVREAHATCPVLRGSARHLATALTIKRL